MKQRPPATDLSGPNASAESLTPRRSNLAETAAVDFQFSFLSVNGSLSFFFNREKESRKLMSTLVRDRWRDDNGRLAHQKKTKRSITCVARAQGQARNAGALNCQHALMSACASLAGGGNTSICRRVCHPFVFADTDPGRFYRGILFDQILRSLNFKFRFSLCRV